VYDKYKRFDAPKYRLALRLEDRVEPYEYPPPGFRTWFVQRIEKLARYYGIMK